MKKNEDYDIGRCLGVMKRMFFYMLLFNFTVFTRIWARKRGTDYLEGEGCSVTTSIEGDYQTDRVSVRV